MPDSEAVCRKWDTDPMLFLITREITFVELQADRFDVPIPANIKFTFEEYHYSEVSVGATFSIMEGGHKVGTGKIIGKDI